MDPEQLPVASLSQCHMLWYLHLCADAGVVVTGHVANSVNFPVRHEPSIQAGEHDA